MMIHPAEPGKQPARRFLIAVAVAHYHRSPYANRPGLVRARQSIIDLFSRRLGYKHVSDVGLDPDRNSLLEHLDRFANDPDRLPDDIVAVYLAGHGQAVGTAAARHMFFPADADLAKPKQALPTSQIASVLLDNTAINQLVLTLDTCHSGQGTADSVIAALGSLRHGSESNSAGVAFVASAQSSQVARARAFPELLSAAVDSLSTGGEKPAALDLGTLVAHMNDNPNRPSTQAIEWHAARLSGEVPNFFPNPRQSLRAPEVDLAIQHVGEWEAQAQQRDTELARRMLVRAMASFGEEGGWWFAGRRRTLTDVTGWLHHADERQPAMVITGGPGSGKTAILGLVAVLTHPERRGSVPLHTLDLPERTIPRTGVVDVAIYAQALTDDEVLRGLAAAAQVVAGTPGALLDTLSGREQPLTVIIDALDEAATPETLVTQLIRPLIRYSHGRIRLLIGTRPHLLRHLHTEVTVIDLDNATYADRPALGAYALRGLTESAPGSLYVDADPGLAVQVARAVADAAFPSFLVARIVAGTLAADASVPRDPDDSAWRRELPRTAESAMARDMEERLGGHAERARDLLRPLAFAEGQGLPWEDVWAPLASRVSGRPYTDDDLLWLRHSTGRYVVEATEAGHSAYRLYHQALAEHLRQGVDESSVNDAYVHVLHGRVPRTVDGSRDWPRAHPYTRRHVATHAARSGHLDEMINDPEYLVYAEPDKLLPALTHITTNRAQHLAEVYQTSAGDHRRGDPLARRQLLAVDAVRFKDRDLSDKLCHALLCRPRWATSSQVQSSHQRTFTSAVLAAATAVVDGVPVAVTSDSDGSVRTWDLRTGAARRVFLGHHGQVNAVACTVVDGVPVAVSGGDDYTVRMWDLRTGEQLAVLGGHAGAVNGIACTMIGTTPVAVVGGGDAAVRIWDLRAHDHLATMLGHTGSVNGVACHVVEGVPVAVTVGAEGGVRMWDLLNNTELCTFAGHTSWVWAVACTEVDGVPVAVTGGGGDGSIRVWDLRGRRQHSRLTGDTGWVNGVACARVDGRAVAVIGGGDHGVRAWDLHDGSLRSVLTGHTSAVNAVASATIDGAEVAVTAGADGVTRVWNLAVGSPRAILAGGPDAASLGDSVPAKGVVKREHCVSARDEPEPNFAGHTGWLWDVDHTSVKGTRVAVTVGGDGDGAIRVWDVTTGDESMVLQGHAGAVNSIACATIDDVPVAMVGGGGDYAVQVWDLATGKPRGALRGQTDWVWAISGAEVQGTPVGVVGDAGGTVGVWDLRTSTPIHTMSSHTGVVNGIACATLDSVPVAVTVGDDGAVRTWDLGTGQSLATFDGGASVLHAVACFTLDGRPAAITVGDDGVGRSWDLRTSELLATFDGHAGVINAVSCAAMAAIPIAVTAGDDHTLRVWDLRTGVGLLCWAMPYPVRAVVLTLGGDIIAGVGHEVVVLQCGANLGHVMRNGRG